MSNKEPIVPGLKVLQSSDGDIRIVIQVDTFTEAMSHLERRDDGCIKLLSKKRKEVLRSNSRTYSHHFPIVFPTIPIDKMETKSEVDQAIAEIKSKQDSEEDFLYQ